MKIILFFAIASLTGYIIGYVVGHCLAEQEYEAKRAELELDEDEDEWDKLFKDISSPLAEFPELPNAIALKEKFDAERNAQKENSWAKISESIENAMSRGKGYVLIAAYVYKNIPFDELLYEVERAEYKLKDNCCCGDCVKYCYDMGYDLSICWE